MLLGKSVMNTRENTSGIIRPGSGLLGSIGGAGRTLSTASGGFSFDSEGSAAATETNVIMISVMPSIILKIPFILRMGSK